MGDQNRISPYNINTISNRKGKFQQGDHKLVQYQILRTYIFRNVWQTVGRVTNRILRVKGLKYDVIVTFLCLCCGVFFSTTVDKLVLVMGEEHLLIKHRLWQSVRHMSLKCLEVFHPLYGRSLSSQLLVQHYVHRSYAHGYLVSTPVIWSLPAMKGGMFTITPFGMTSEISKPLSTIILSPGSYKWEHCFLR